MVGRKELPCGLIAEIAAHKDFAEVVVEFAVVVHDGGEQGIHLCEDLCEFLLLVGLITADNLQIPFFPFIFLCKVKCVGNGDCAALEQVGHEFGSIYRISGFFNVLYDIVYFRDWIGAKVVPLGNRYRLFENLFGNILDRRHCRFVDGKIEKEERRHYYLL